MEVMAYGGTGQKFAYVTTVVAGLCSLMATVMSVVYVPSPLLIEMPLTA